MLSAARRFLSTPGARAFAARGAAVATAAAGVGAFSAQCDSIKLNVTIPVEVDVDQHGQLTTSWSSTDVDELVAAQHGQWSLGSARPRLLRLLKARLAALGSSVLRQPLSPQPLPIPPPLTIQAAASREQLEAVLKKGKAGTADSLNILLQE